MVIGWSIEGLTSAKDENNRYWIGSMAFRFVWDGQLLIPFAILWLKVTLE